MAVHGLGTQGLLECQKFFDNLTTAEAAAANAKPHAWHAVNTFWTGPNAGWEVPVGLCQPIEDQVRWKRAQLPQNPADLNAIVQISTHLGLSQTTNNPEPIVWEGRAFHLFLDPSMTGSRNQTGECELSLMAGSNDVTSQFADICTCINNGPVEQCVRQLSRSIRNEPRIANFGRFVPAIATHEKAWFVEPAEVVYVSEQDMFVEVRIAFNDSWSLGRYFWSLV